MNYAEFLNMGAELSIIVVILLLFVYDLFAKPQYGKYISLLTITLLVIQTAYIFTTKDDESTLLFGDMYLNIGVTTIAKVILNIGTILVFMQSAAWINSNEMAIKRGEYYILTLITLLGMYIMISSQNLLMLFIGIETASLPMTALIAMEKYKHNSFESAAKYIFYSLFSSAFMLLGVSFIYGAVGTLYYDYISMTLTATPLTIVGLVLFIAGFGFKLSLVPFHLWTADVYQGAPTTVTTYLSVISKGAAAFALMMALYTMFAPMQEVWTVALYIIIIATITIGNLFAIRQKDLKRFLAFSSISQAGYIILPILAGTEYAASSLLYYILVYIFSNIAAFTVISIIEQKRDKLTIDSYDGLYKTNPKLSIVMMFAMFSLAGIPPFAGFFSKFFVFYAAAEQGHYVIVFIALLNTIISLFYYLMVVKAMFLKENENPIAAIKSDGFTKATLLISTLGIILLGLVSCIFEGIFDITSISF